MLTSQKLTLRQSEIRLKLSELQVKDPYTDEEQAEMRRLNNEFAECETRHSAALITEIKEAENRELEFSEDGEGAEFRTLKDQAHLGNYLIAGRSGSQLTGAEAEFNKALKIGVSDGVTVPWHILETRQEHRAPTTTTQLDGGTDQRPIRQRLFDRDIFDAAGVRVDSVPMGMSEWPLLTGGVAPVQTAESGTAPTAVPATFDTTTLKPKRLSGQYQFGYEMAAQVQDIEQALRRDLADSVRSSMNSQILNSAAPDASDPQRVTGFYARLAAPTAPTAEANYSDYARTPAQGVDGIHASMEGECAVIVGTDVYQHAAGIFQTGSGEAGIEAMMRRGRMVMASSFVPAAAATISDGSILHAGMDNMRGDSVCAIWSPGLEIIRDIYTRAAQGEVILTWVGLWDCYVAFRQSAYARLSYKIAP